MATGTQTTYDIDVQTWNISGTGTNPCWRVSSSRAATDRSRSWSNCMGGLGSGGIVWAATRATKRWRRTV